MKDYFIILLLIIGIRVVLVSQSLAHDFPMLKWGIIDGMNSQDVTSVVQDKNGMVWVATKEGIYRHDGNKLTNLNKICHDIRLDDPLNVVQLFVDNKNRIWIGTFFSGLFKYEINSNSFSKIESVYDGFSGIGNMRIYGIQELSENVIQFTSHSKGLIKYFIDSDSCALQNVFTDSLELAKKDGFQLMLNPIYKGKHKEKTNWYSSLDGLVMFDQEKDTFIYFNPPDKRLGVRDAYMDDSNSIWCGTYSMGVYKFEPASKSWENYRCHSGEDHFENCLNTSAIIEYDPLGFVLGTYHGIYFMDKENKDFTSYYKFTPEAPWIGVSESFNIIDDHLWITSYSTGLIKHSKPHPGVTTVHTHGNLSNVYHDEVNDRYLSVGYNTFFTVHEKETFQEVPIPDNLIVYDTESILYDGKFIWILGSQELLRYDEVQKRYSQPFMDLLRSIGVEHLHFRKFLLDRNNNFWLISHDGTVIRIDTKKNKIQTFGGLDENSIPMEYSYRAHLAAYSIDNKIWMSGQDGFFYISDDGKEMSFAKDIRNAKGELIEFNSPSVAVHSSGKVCFGEKLNELYFIQASKIRNITAELIALDTPLPAVRIVNVSFDSFGNIWATTKNGLYKIDLDLNEYYFYGDELNIDNCDLIIHGNSSKKILLANSKFHIIDTELLTPKKLKHNLLLNYIEVNGVQVFRESQERFNTGDEITLRPNDKVVRLGFNDYCYDTKRSKEYVYKIEGLNEDWIDLGERNEITLTSLPANAKSVLVKSKAKFELTFTQPIEILKLNVIPPLINRLWFRFFILGIIGIFGVLLYRYRINQLEEKQKLIISFNKRLAETEMKALRAQMNPHFLFNVLNAIKLNVQKNEQEKAISFITDFSKLIRSVLQNSGQQKITLTGELEALELYMKIENKRFSSFEYEINIDPNVSTDSIMIPPLLLQPYVENAIWHGILHKDHESGLIIININQVSEFVYVEIIDNGIGREMANTLKLKTAHRKKSMGMQITKDRMAINNQFEGQKYQVEIVDLYDVSGLASGTKVIIAISD